MPPDLWSLYALMLKSRLFEEAVTQLWKEGLISGEMHLGTGEEAIIAGIVSQLSIGDAMALDHRGTLRRTGVSRVGSGHPDSICPGLHTNDYPIRSFSERSDSAQCRAHQGWC